MKAVPMYFMAHLRLLYSTESHLTLGQFRRLLLDAEHRARHRKPVDHNRWLLATECLFANLVAACGVLADGLMVRMHRNAATLDQVFGMSHIAAVKAAVAAELLVLHRQSFVINGKIRSLSWVTATATLEQLLQQTPTQSLRFERSLVAPIVLKSRKDDDGGSERLPLPITQETLALTEAQRKINRYLERMNIGYNFTLWLTHDSNYPTAMLNSTQQTALTRIFNNGTLNEGGRLFGGWWQSLPKAIRQHNMLINSDTVVHVDYKELYLRLAYHHFGIDWPFGPGEDAYVADSSISRDEWKRVTNALLSARSRLYQFPGTALERCAMRQTFGLPAGQVFERIYAKHPLLYAAEAFGTGLTHRLARIESDLITEVMLACIRDGLSALPVHDCIMVPASQQERAISIMTACAEDMGLALPVAIS